MQEYPIKRGHHSKRDLIKCAMKHFPDVSASDDKICFNYGTLESVRAWEEGKTKLCVEVVNDKSYAQRIAQGDEAALNTAMQTQKLWNQFLEEATGFTAKERSKKMQKAVKQ